MKTSSTSRMGLETTMAGYYLNKKEEKDKPVQTLPSMEKFNVEQLFYLSFVLVCELLMMLNYS